jgi:hypothetical protein
MAILAMPRAEFEKRRQADPLLKWLTLNTSGVLVGELQLPETTVPIDVKELPLTTYRVEIKDGKLSAETVGEKKSGAGDSFAPVATLAFGVMSSLSLTWLGVWLARRRGKA